MISRYSFVLSQAKAKPPLNGTFVPIALSYSSHLTRFACVLLGAAARVANLTIHTGTSVQAWLILTVVVYHAVLVFVPAIEVLTIKNNTVRTRKHNLVLFLHTVTVLKRTLKIPRTFLFEENETATL